MTRTCRRARTVAAIGLLILLTVGCEYRGADSLPLPGAEGGGDTYAVTVVLHDATNLVPKETCRANDTVIGSVESVELDEQLEAEVVCRIHDEVDLPANVVATVRETSLLGERYVALDVPQGARPRGTLEPGSVLPAATTRVDPNVEIVLGALSQVLNGGGLANVETITRELTLALQGSDLGATVDGLGEVVGVLDDNRSSITASLDSLDRLTRTLTRQRDVIGSALEAIPDGLAVLDRQRPRLVALFRRLSELSHTAVPLIRASREDAVADLQHLQPVLEQLASASDELSRTVERLASFPFPSNTLRMLRGDYAGMSVNLQLDIDSLNALLGGPGTLAGPTPVTGGPDDDTPAEDPLADLPLDLPGLDVSALDPDLLGLLSGGAR